MSIFPIGMLNFLLQQVVVGFDMWFFLNFKFNFFAVIAAFFMLAFHAYAENQVKIIERDNFQKRIRVEAITDKTTGRLKDYITFSFYVKEQLIFCHMSKDRSAPAVICH